jgi:protein SCO1/2
MSLALTEKRTRRKTRAIAVCACALLLILLPLPSRADQRYAASGIILGIDLSQHTLNISCKEIPGYMSAMVMSFPARNPTELVGLLPGKMIDFTLVVSKDSAVIESIHIHAFQSGDQEPMAARQLSILGNLVDSHTAVTPPLTIGEHVPDFSLVSQNRQSVKLSQFAGKVVALTFLYTHCPLSNFCFKLSNNFGVVQKRFADRLDRDLILLSISFDPEHDQPEVLAQYAQNWKAAEIKGWYFLTGPVPEVQKITLEFGMNFWQDEGLFVHGLHTVILDRDGRMLANLEGNEFTPRQLGDLLQSVLDKARN